LKKTANRLSEREIEIIFGLADNRLSTKKTADSLFFSQNAVIYHVNRIKMKTGLDAKDFYDLTKLIEIVKAQREESKEEK
jgi:sugar diacid utilization regulator